MTDLQTTVFCQVSVWYPCFRARCLDISAVVGVPIRTTTPSRRMQTWERSTEENLACSPRGHPVKVAYWLSFTVAEDHLSFLRGPKGSSGFTDQGPRSGWLQDL